MTTQVIADTATRVSEQTAENVNRRIRHQTQANVLHCALQPEHVEARLRDLDREWDIERVLEINYALVNLLGLTLGATASRKWHWLPAVAGGFMLMHVLTGWCPPLPVLRRMGVRTASEIDAEKYALMALQGNFEGVGSASDSESRALAALEAVAD